MSHSLICLIFSFITFSQALASFEDLEITMNKYRTSAHVMAAVKKKVISSIMNKETIFEGQLDYSLGKLRLAISSPNKEIVLYDGATIWTEQHLPKELGGEVQVSKSKVDKKSKSKIFISSILSQKNFNISLEKSQNGYSVYKFLPNNGDPYFKTIYVYIHSGKNEIAQIKYFDDLENETIFIFKGTVFLKEARPQVFKYKIPKGIKVTEL